MKERMHSVRNVLLALVVALGVCWLGLTTMMTSVSAKETLRVGTEGTYPPYSYHDKDGELVGYDVEIARGVAEELGIEIEFVEAPWESLIAALDADQVDAIFDQATILDERKEKYLFSEPYTEPEGAVIVHEDNQDIQEFDDIKGRKLAEVLNSDWALKAEDNGAELVVAQGIEQALELVGTGRADATLNDKATYYSYLKQHPDAPVKIVAEDDDVRQTAALLPKTDTELQQQISDAIVKLKDDGTIDELADKYFDSVVREVENGDHPSRAARLWGITINSIGSIFEAGVLVTSPLTLVSFALGLVLAVITALIRYNHVKLLEPIARFYVWVVRGTPLLVQLFIIYYGLPKLGIQFNEWAAAILAFTLNTGAYTSETIRSAIAAVPEGQWEAAASFGLKRSTIFRKIIGPQALRVAITPLFNSFIGLIKDTSLASNITLVEMFMVSQRITARTYEPLLLYILVALVYLLFCTVLTYLQRLFEKRTQAYDA